MDMRDLLAETAILAPGVKAISLLGLDGIPVETVIPGAGDDVPQEAAIWQLEVADLLRGAGQATERLGWAAAGDLTLEAGDLTLLARQVTSGYFLLLIMDSSANVTRAAYELRRAASLLAGA